MYVFLTGKSISKERTLAQQEIFEKSNYGADEIIAIIQSYNKSMPNGAKQA